MSQIIPLQSQELPKDCFVFKHSTQCPISGAAADEVRDFDFSLPLYWINVIEERPNSNWVEATYNVEHESPQLLRIKDGAVAGVLNHRAIVKKALETF